jgi:hypothetical protein
MVGLPLRTGSLHRRGITVTRVIVVLILAITLLGILLVVVPALRERANRVACANNLKEQGVGCRSFRDIKGYLPAARIADAYGTWAVQIAPHLKLKDNRLNAWDLSRSYYAQAEDIRQAQVIPYYCPSRRQPPQLSVSGDVPLTGRPAEREFPGALGDYAACSGNGDPAHPWQTAQANGAVILGEVLKKSDDQIFLWRGRVDLGDLTKGQSPTILLGEKHVPWGQFGRGQAGDSSLYNGDYPASSARVGGPGFGLASSPEAPFHNNFGSYHPGICQFLKADLSVQQLANSINEEVLGRLTVR